MVNFVQASSKYQYADAMDVSYVDSSAAPRSGGDEAEEDIPLDALSRDTCARCGGFGHYAKKCATPDGKTRLKGAGKGQGYGKGQDVDKGQGQARLCCNCGRLGHTKATSWELHPDKKASGGKGQEGRAKTNGLDEEVQDE